VGYPQPTIYPKQLKYSGVQPALKYIEIKFLLFLHVFSFILNEYDKIKCFKKSVVGYIVGWTPEFFSCLGYIVGCGYPTHTRGNSVAHVCIGYCVLCAHYYNTPTSLNIHIVHIYIYIDYAYTCKSAVKSILFFNFYHICYYYIFVFLEIA